MTRLVFVLYLLSVASGCASASKTNPVIAIGRMLEQQAACWNSGDVEGFMRGYWQNDQLTFSAGGETTRGWSRTLARYREKYPTADDMGQLTFDELEFHSLNSGAMLVLGRWHVTKPDADIAGNFSLVLRRFGGEWRIVHDHTSVDA